MVCSGIAHLDTPLIRSHAFPHCTISGHLDQEAITFAGVRLLLQLQSQSSELMERTPLLLKRSCSCFPPNSLPPTWSLGLL
jgi:hypothetical protein